MNKFAMRLALLALLGATAAVSPAFAAPSHSINCDDPKFKDDPACTGKIPVNRGVPVNKGFPVNNNPPPNNPLPDANQFPHNNNNFQNNNMGNQGGFVFGPGQHQPHDQPDQFRQFFRAFNYGMFAQPTFSIRIGAMVPRSFNLRAVPRQIYRDFPEYRGFLFFVLRDGSIVIVNPRNHRIVDII